MKPINGKKTPCCRECYWIVGFDSCGHCCKSWCPYSDIHPKSRNDVVDSYTDAGGDLVFMDFNNELHILKEKPMKIIPTEKELTFHSLFKEVNFGNGCERDGWINLVQWYIDRKSETKLKEIIVFGTNGRFNAYLDKHEDLKQWLVEKGFAKEAFKVVHYTMDFHSVTEMENVYNAISERPIMLENPTFRDLHLFLGRKI